MESKSQCPFCHEIFETPEALIQHLTVGSCRLDYQAQKQMKHRQSPEGRENLPGESEDPKAQIEEAG